MTMTIEEIIAEFTELAEVYGPQTEVRIASQPNWPFEYDIQGISTLHPKQEEINDLEETLVMDSDLTDEDKENIENELNVLRNEEQPIYLVEGTQIGYTSKDHWE